MTYRPLPKQVTIKQSNIEGLGLYSTESLIHGKFLGVSHVANDKFENGYIRTPLGGYINHDEEPNCYLSINFEWDDYKIFHLFTRRKILEGEELLLDYDE